MYGVAHLCAKDRVTFKVAGLDETVNDFDF